MDENSVRPLSTPGGTPARGIDVPLGEPHQLADRLDAGRDAGASFARLAIAWNELQPRPARLHGGSVEAVQRALATIHTRGYTPWVVLEADPPAWFENEGGFADAGAVARYWPRWVEVAADSFGDQVGGWVPLPRPFALARHGRDLGQTAKVLDTLVVAWRDAWRILRGPAPVATELDVAVVSAQCAQPEAIDAAEAEERMRWHTWLRGLTTGELVVPGRAARQLADLAGSGDVLGLSFTEQLEHLVHRAAEDGPALPLAVALAPHRRWSEAQLAEASDRVWTDSVRIAGELDLRWVTLPLPAG